jgi:anti-sigma B factor antagonist
MISQDIEEHLLVVDQNLTASAINKMREQFKSIVAQKHLVVKLDCTNVDKIDSMGIGLIVAFHNSLNKQGSQLQLVGLNQELFDLFTTMRLHKHFKISLCQ